MAKSKKAKPSFDRTLPTPKSDAAAWVYRSDTPAVVIDVAPISTTLVATRRVVSPVERGIDLLSRPFGLVIMLGVAVLGVFRSRRALMCLLVVGGLASASCRYETIWSGVEFQDDGRLKLAAEDPLCGCLTIANISGKDLALLSRFHGTRMGSTVLKAGAKLSFRFDWAGQENDDVYTIAATDSQGNEVNLKTAIRIEDKSNWQSCDPAPCPYGDLLLNMGESGH